MLGLLVSDPDERWDAAQLRAADYFESVDFGESENQETLFVPRIYSRRTLMTCFAPQKTGGRGARTPIDLLVS